MAKRRRKVRRKRSTTSTSSCSSSSSVSRRPLSSSSSSSSSSSAEAAKPSKGASSGAVPQSSRAPILVPSLLALRDKSRVITQGPEHDPSDGAIVYSTKDVALYKQDKAQKALSDNWGIIVVSTQIPSCVSTISRSNKRKFHQVLDKILSRT